jgi:hypothetical protein
MKLNSGVVATLSPCESRLANKVIRRSEPPISSLLSLFLIDDDAFATHRVSQTLGRDGLSIDQAYAIGGRRPRSAATDMINAALLATRRVSSAISADRDHRR